MTDVFECELGCFNKDEPVLIKDICSSCYNTLLDLNPDKVEEFEKWREGNILH